MSERVELGEKERSVVSGDRNRMAEEKNKRYTDTDRQIFVVNKT